MFEARAADWIRRLLPTIGRERFSVPLRMPEKRPAGKGGNRSGDGGRRRELWANRDLLGTESVAIRVGKREPNEIL